MNYASTGKENKKMKTTVWSPRLLVVGSKDCMVVSKDTRQTARTRRTVE